MIFLEGNSIKLSVLPTKEYIELLNQNFDGSQLHRLPLLLPMDTDSKNLILAVTINRGSEVLGRVSLENIDHLNQSAEFKIFIFHKNQGSGYGFEASELIIKHGFEELNLHRIYCGTLDNNIGFQKLADKIGFEKEGLRKEAVFKGGKWHDVIEYGIIRK